jgi:hypothetical protein
MGASRIIKQKYKTYVRYKNYKIAIETIKESIKVNIIEHLTINNLKR